MSAEPVDLHNNALLRPEEVGFVGTYGDVGRWRGEARLAHELEEPCLGFGTDEGGAALDLKDGAKRRHARASPVAEGEGPECLFGDVGVSASAGHHSFHVAEAQQGRSVHQRSSRPRHREAHSAATLPRVEGARLVDSKSCAAPYPHPLDHYVYRPLGW